MENQHKTKRNRPTMQDVARLAGVSQPTVSRVLHRTGSTPQISENTRQRVLAAVSELGYRPNVAARNLRTRRSQTIALLLADLANSFYHPIARAVQDIAHEHDYEVLIANSDHLYDNEKLFCEIVLGRGVDGAIMVPIRITSDELGHFVSQHQMPLVVLGQHITHPNIDVVRVDDEQATYETTNWLISQCGHRKIGFVGVPDYYPPGPRRLRGFARAMREAGLPLDARWMPHGDFTRESGVRAAQALMQAGELPSALIVLNDLMAIGVILTLQEAGYSIPDDVAVVGFDNIPEATIVRPTLTTIAQDPRDIGRKLATALFERIKNPDIVERRVFESPTQFIRRQSA